MQREHRFDVDRRDVFAAADDHVVDAAGDVQVAVFVEVAGVAGEVPAVAQDFAFGVRTVPVAFECFVAEQVRNDLAFFAARRRESSGDFASSFTTRSRVLMPARPALPGFFVASWSMLNV